VALSGTTTTVTDAKEQHSSGLDALYSKNFGNEILADRVK
jgi:hypothetical protein